jgi:hypothetical protein
MTKTKKPAAGKGAKIDGRQLPAASNETVANVRLPVVFKRMENEAAVVAGELERRYGLPKDGARQESSNLLAKAALNLQKVQNPSGFEDLLRTMLVSDQLLASFRRDLRETMKSRIQRAQLAGVVGGSVVGLFIGFALAVMALARTGS